MIDFDLFVRTLGPHAKHYTHEQLEQLHAEVHKLAAILVDDYRAKMANRTDTSPQSALDQPNDDRTLEAVLIEPVEGPDPPPAPD